MDIQKESNYCKKQDKVQINKYKESPFMDIEMRYY